MMKSEVVHKLGLKKLALTKGRAIFLMSPKLAELKTTLSLMGELILFRAQRGIRIMSYILCSLFPAKQGTRIKHKTPPLICSAG